jgi:hypothetical protein
LNERELLLDVAPLLEAIRVELICSGSRSPS